MYAGVVLKDMGMDVAAGVAAAGIVKLFCAIAAAFVMDCVGRRPLVLGGTLGMLLATAMLSAGCCAGLDTTGGRAVALTGFYLLVLFAVLFFTERKYVAVFFLFTIVAVLV